MYLDNKYTKWYYRIIDNSVNRQLMSDEYTETHHIIPKSIGGSNDSSNLAVLSAREHFICHLLLTKMLCGEDKNKMTFAAWAMTNLNNKYQRRNRVNSRIYEILKKQKREIMSSYMQTNNPMHNENFRHRHAESMKTRINIGMTGKIHKGETIEKMRERRATQIITENTKNKIRNFMREAAQSSDYVNPMLREGVAEKHKLACILRSSKKITCQHCNREFSSNTFGRYHGDKCKSK